MMIRQTMVSAAMGLALAAAAPTTWAEGSGFYFGVAGGQSQFDVSQDELDELVFDTFDGIGAPVISGTSDLEDKDTSFALFGGYRFSQYFALEAGYIDFGTAEYRSSGTVDPIGPQSPLPAAYAVDFELKGFTAAAIGAVPLGQRFDLHARLGVLFADLDITESASISTSSASETYSADSRDLFYGVGAGLQLGAHWSFSLDWQQFKDVGDEEDTGEADVDRISLGVMYKL